MFKSCQYCRYRKKRCAFPPPGSQDSRCFACQHLNVTCEIASRLPSAKRQRTSQQISAQVATTQASDHDASSLDDGDCQLAGRKEKELLLPQTSLNLDGFGSKELYVRVVQQDFPFVAAEYLEGQLSPLLEECIRHAAQLSFQVHSQSVSENRLQHVMNDVQVSELELPEAAGFLLLLSRMEMPPKIAEMVFQCVSRLDNVSLPAPIAAGALTAHTWLSLLGRRLPAIDISVGTLLDYAADLKPDTFGAHLLKLTHLAAKLAGLLRTTNEVNTVTTKQWANIEHASLLNVAQMRSEFLDVRDDMPATPAAVITHMLQNLIYLRLYHYLLCENINLGESLALRPIPGVLHFICAITRSTFICQPQLLQYWPLIADIQAVAAQTMIDLWNLTRSENCRALLNLWKPSAAQEELARTARDCAGSGPWSVEAIDGYSTFWTFRDVRSLCLEVLMRQ